MLEDAYNEILSLVKSNEKVNFISIDRNSKVSVAVNGDLTDPKNIQNFDFIQEALEFIEKL